MSMLRYNEPELHRIVNELNAVADSWQMEWEQAKHIVFGNTHISPWAASREAEHRFDERIGLVLIDAYLNGGFRADPRWRNLIAMRKKAKANETHFYWQRMGWGIFETILYKLSFHNRCKLLISDRIRALRYVASRVTLTPKDHIDHRTENKYRRNRYRLPKAQRTTLSTYIQMQQFNPRGDYSSMEEALKEPWRVRLLTLETSETQLPDEIMKFTYLTYLKLSGKNLLALPE